VNLYVYVGNNSINRFDIFGLWEFATEYGTAGEGLTENITTIERDIDRAFNKIANRDAVVTYTINGMHKTGSLHYSGNAIDLRTRDLTISEKSRVAQLLKEILGDNYDVVVEKTHIHVEYDPPNEPCRK